MQARFLRFLRQRAILALMLTLLLLPALAAADYSHEREQYRAALADLDAVRLSQFERRLQQLSDYPLLPYLHYARLLRYISSAEPEAIEAFRDRFADTHLADRLLLHWLDNLARRGEWALYRAHFDPEVATRTDLQCRYHRAQHETGDTEQALRGAARLWLSGESLPDVCDPLFEAWRQHGGPGDALAWQRLNLALDANNPHLARYLVRYLDDTSQPLAKQFIRLHRRPQTLQALEQLDGASDRVATVIAHTLQRLARLQPLAADALWAHWGSRIDMPPGEARQVRTQLVRWQLRRDEMPIDYNVVWPPPELSGATQSALIEELLRHAIRGQKWSETVSWIARLPAERQQAPEWRYWQARASLELDAESPQPDNPMIAVSHPSGMTPGGRLTAAAARNQLAALAEERHYYGFMAAHRLGRPFALGGRTPTVSDSARMHVVEHPALQRALELEALNERADMRRELAWLRDHLSGEALTALAEQAHERGWHTQAIRTAIAANRWDLLALRFPIPHRESMLREAGNRNLEPSWLYAIARQESAFMADARSPAGALGLMQVMPATARLTARRENISLTSNWQLLNQDKNIEIGAAYLARMSARYDGNRILASAAYNAGPGRVDRWLRELPQAVPADVWIESIPFHETRNYVQNVLAYSVIYDRHLDQPDKAFLRVTEFQETLAQQP